MCEAGRKWLLCIDEWMTGTYSLEFVLFFPQLFVLREGSAVKLLIGKATCDFLITGKSDDIKYFIKALVKAFRVDKAAIVVSFRFLGCDIDVRDDSLEVSMWDYL